jgi:hypothetical protein
MKMKNNVVLPLKHVDKQRDRCVFMSCIACKDCIITAYSAVYTGIHPYWLLATCNTLHSVELHMRCATAQTVQETASTTEHLQSASECNDSAREPQNRLINVQKHERISKYINKKQTPWSESASELYRPSDRRLSAKWLPTFADRGCHVVSVTDPYGRILDFLDRSRYFSIK